MRGVEALAERPPLLPLSPFERGFDDGFKELPIIHMTWIVECGVRSNGVRREEKGFIVAENWTAPQRERVF